MRMPLERIEFFNGVPTMRGLGPLVQDKDADLFYDTELQLIGIQMRTSPLGNVRPMFFVSPVGVAMTPFPKNHERWAATRPPKEKPADVRA